MRVSWPILIAGILVAIAAIAMGEWMTLGAVAVVLVAIQWWHPVWAKHRDEAEKQISPATAPAELVSLYRWRRVLVPLAGVSVFVNGWAYLHVIAEGTHYGTSLVTTLVGFVFAVWALQTQRKIERLEDVFQS